MDQPSRIFLLFAAASIAALPARGEDAVMGPGGPAPTVRGKLYQVSRRWEVGFAFTTALNDSLVDQYGGLLSISYHPNEWMDVGGDLLAGAGGAAFRHESVNLCGAPGDGACAPADYQSATSLKPIGELGAGMRVYLGQRWSLRAELRGFFYPATVLRGADLTQPGTGTSASYLGTFTTLVLGASALF